MQRIRTDGGESSLVAQHRPPDRLVGKRRGLEVVEDDVVGRVARLAQLLEHHLALLLQLAGIEVGRVHEPGDQLDRKGQVTGQRAGVEDGHVARRPGIELTAHILDRLGDGARRAPGRALEHHVLEQMGKAVLFGRLEPRAGVSIKANRHRRDTRHGIAEHGQPVGQRRRLDHGRGQWPC